MAAIPENCIVIQCDVCDAKVGEDDDGTRHFIGIADAMDWGKHVGPEWTILSDGSAVCGAGDQPHRDAIAALLPPEPTMVMDGQTAIEVPGAGD
jgi:hypothetical protein